jgi:DNA mismatch repair protein MutS
LENSVYQKPEETSSFPKKYPPMLVEYLSYKERYPDYIILFQVGDFYEIFFDDAVLVAKTINITLTSRDKSSDNPVRMCGVPIAVLETYLHRMLESGFSVVIVSQEQANIKSVGNKQIIKRSISKIVTPGIRILSESSALKNGEGYSAESSERIAALYVDSLEQFSIAYTDILSGKVFIRENIPMTFLYGELQKIQPSEIIFSSRIGGRALDKRSDILKKIEHFWKVPLKIRGESYLDNDRFDYIKGFLLLTPEGKKAMKLLLSFVDETNVAVEACITEVTVASDNNCMYIESTTRNNLELVKNLKSSHSLTLFSFLNRTGTFHGGKLLREWILSPLVDRDSINERLNAVSFLVRHISLLRDWSEKLKLVPDLERIATRLTLAVSSPRELGALRDSIYIAAALCSYYENEKAHIGDDTASKLIDELLREIHFPVEISQLIQDYLSEVLPNRLEETGVIRDGFCKELDELRLIVKGGDTYLKSFEMKERAKTGINSLKVKYNNIIGYFIEVTNTHASKIPPEYTPRQSTVNALRFTVPELKTMELKLLHAQSKLIALEKRYFLELIQKLKPHSEAIRHISYRLAILDVLLSLANVSVQYSFLRPEISDSEAVIIKNGTHPLLLSILGNQCIPNSIVLGTDAFQTAIPFIDSPVKTLIISGPNMGGKSTYLKQVALTVIMAQLGCFVPAEYAQIGIVDKLFARIGTADDLLEGESTFMVEMRETAAILTTATKKSLVLIDEVGRGTSSIDGFCLAQAIIDWIVETIMCRTLFATHFHELTELSKKYNDVGNVTVGIIESGEDVIFTHQITPGSAKRSYGFDVAKLAGIPIEVIERAKVFFEEKEQVKLIRNDQSPDNQLFADKNEDLKNRTVKNSEVLHQQKNNIVSLKNLAQQNLSLRRVSHDTKMIPLQKKLSFVQDNNIVDIPKEVGTVLSMIREVDIDKMTPFESMQYLYRLKKMCKG